MAARSGLQMCAALDALGAVAPWREYMLAFLRESEDDNTSYGEVSDRAVDASWLRGRLRLASFGYDQTSGSSHASTPSSAHEDGDRDLYAPVNWGRLANRLDESGLPPTKVVEAILDTFGLPAVVELIGELAHPGAYCLALAESIAVEQTPDSDGDALYWASRAADSGIPPGSTSRLIAIGLDVGEIDTQPIEEARERLLDLTREVQDHLMFQERLGEWLDACTLAARNDPVGLATAEALLEGPGWYTCWLRFTIALAIAETASMTEQSQLSLAALRILTEVQNPFLGNPRACDLYSIDGLIDETLWRAVSLLDDQSWEEAIKLLDRVSASISTSFRGEMGGPIRRDRLLHLAVNTATETRRTAVQRLVSDEIESYGGGRYYSDLAEYQLIAARLALNADDPTEARRHWIEACRLLVAYGWRKDVTIYELLDPLPTLIAIDPARSRAAVAKVQPLCDRVVQHTDGRETSHARSRWWQLLAAVDPCALSRLIQPKLLSSCNDPNWLLHGARSDLWRTWYHRADPIVAGALRLTLDEPLDKNDPNALGLLADICDGTGDDQPSRLMVTLLARIDERPFKYSYSNSNELLDRNRERVDELNSIAERARVPRIAPLPTSSIEADSDHHSRSRSVPHLPDQVIMMFQPSAVGVVQAIRAWQGRQYDETRPSWSVERFVNVLGYRIIELMEAGREGDVRTAVRLIADAGRFDDRQELLRSLAEGFERHGQGSLAAMTYTLAWTRTRGHGGWLTFGGETEIESLQRATQLDRALVLKTIAEEVERVVSRRSGTYGITRALMYGFAKGGLGSSISVPFDIWNEAFIVIADRLPRVTAADDPEDIYVVPDPDNGTDLLGNIDTAFAMATIAGLAHPGREQKRRALVGAQVLINERASAVTAALESAFSSLSDPATLTWLLRVIELAGEKAAPIISGSRSTLIELTGRPHLTVRALARRILSSDEVPLVPSAEPDPELLDRGSTGILLPTGATVSLEDTAQIDGIIDAVAGVRLLHAEPILPGIRQAVHKRIDELRSSEKQKQRMQTQLRAYADRPEKRWPDAYLVSEEAVEDGIQRVAAGARAARLMNGDPVGDPVELEEELAQALLDDPELPLVVELTRQPRPELPPPPLRGDPLWRALRARAEGGGIDETGIKAASQNGDALIGTVSISSTEAVPILVDGPYGGWRLVAAVERRVIPRSDISDKEDDIAKRYRVVELRLSEDRQALNSPPIAEGDIREWSFFPMPDLSVNGKIQSQPVVGFDSAVRAAGDGHHGLGIQGDLFTPLPWLSAVLMLKWSAHFVIDDDDGRAMALITWRTEYETSDYHLAWPRLCGTGLVVRGDAFDRLVHAAQGGLIFRDFLMGSSSLCSCQSSGTEGNS